MDIVKFNKANISGNHLIIPDNITRKQWLHLGSAIRTLEIGSKGWYNDWSKFGIKKEYTDVIEVGNIYSELELLTGLSRSTLKKRKYLTGKIDGFRQRNDLTPAHHMEVTSLSPELQDDFLQKASENHWTVKQLRKEIKLFKQSGNESTPKRTLQIECMGKVKVMEQLGDTWREVDHIEIF
ncbi:MAG: hypothetical protein WC222_11625 [Parachlamydiales bacterium]|jgi:hypothetical protein